MRMPRRRPIDPLEPTHLHEELARELGDRPRVTYVFTRDASRQLDRQATDTYGIPGIALMENAARGAADTALRLLEDVNDQEPGVLIVCGPGNNGGDGLAIARHLHNAGASVRIALLAPVEKVSGDAAVNLDIVRRMKLPLTVLPAVGTGAAFDRLVASDKPDLVVDALLGTGVSGSLRGPVLEVIPAINALRKLGTRVLSIDLPSGMDADTGVSLGQTVIADVTVTMAGLKKGFESLEAQNFLGEVIVADIGVPKELLAKLGRKIRPAQHQPEEPPPEPPARDRAPKRR